MPTRSVLLTILVILTAGCVQTPTDVRTASLDMATVLTGEPASWTGAELRGDSPGLQTQVGILARCLAIAECVSASAACEPANCARHEILIPSGQDASDLVVGLRWPSIDPVWMALWIEDDSGSVIAEGRSTTIDHNGASAVLVDPAPGRYQIAVAIMWGTSDYELAARLVHRVDSSGAPRDILPDIVTLPPTDLRFEDPPGHYLMNALVLPTNPVANAMGARYCSSDEASAGARLCLRFTNAVANLGEGPLDVALSAFAGATHAAGGRFVQRIYATDGSMREVPAGAAEFHAIHGHWHNAGSNAFQVYAYDAEAKIRGAAVAEGRKTGMCFADVGIVDPAWLGLGLQDHQGVQCFNPAIDREWSMGLAPGWYDSYPWLLNDQYVDVAELADGTYVLCSSANADGFLQEMDATNNEGCTAFTLSGTLVEPLDPLPYHAQRP